MNEINDSLLEIAVALMKRKKKPQTLESMLDEVFQKKGMEKDEQTIAQFEVDFMLSGLFIYCGEDKDKNQLWDLKERQPSSLLDKDGGYLDLYENDEEVIKNELKDDTLYTDKNVDEFINDDDIEDKEEEDDIEEEIRNGMVDDEGETQEIDSSEFEEYEEDELDEEEEEDDIEEAIRKQKK